MLTDTRSQDHLLTSISTLVNVEERTTAGDWEINWNRLAFIKLLGSGQFGEVQQMMLQKPGLPARLVAVKTLIDEVSEVAKVVIIIVY